MSKKKVILQERHFKYLLNFIFKYHIAIVVVSLLLAVLSVYITTNLKFQTSFVDLLPQDTPSARDLNNITEKAGGVGFLLIPLETKNITAGTERFAKKLTKELEKMPEIRYVILGKNKDFIEPRFLYFLDTVDVKEIHKRVAHKLKVERKKVNPFYFDLLGEDVPLDFSDIEEKYKGDNSKRTMDLETDYYVNEANTILAIRAKPTKPSSDLAYSRDLINKTERLIRDLKPKSYDPHLQVSVIGRYKTFVEENQIMVKDLQRSLILAIILAVTLIIAFTRKIRAIFLIFTPLLMAISYTFAFTTLTLGHVNLITAFLGAVLAGLGVDFGIHMFIRYNHERRLGRDLRDAIFAILSSTGKATFIAALTTSATFFTLTIMNFKGFSEFGLIAGSGILFCLLTIYIVLPSLAILFERISPVKPKEKTLRAVERVSGKRFPIPGKIILLCILAVILSAVAIPHVNFEGDFRKLKAKGRLYDKQDKVEEEVFGSALSPSLIVTEKIEDLAKLKTIIKDIKKSNEEKGKSFIDQALSIKDLVPEEQDKKYYFIKKLNEMAHDRVLNLLEGKEKEHVDDLKKITSAKPYTLDDVPEDIVSKLRLPKPHKGWFTLLYPKIMDNENLWEVKQALKFSEETDQIKEATTKAGITYELVAEILIYADIMKLIISEGPIALILALLAVTLLLFIDFRKLNTVFIVTTPLVVGAVATFGVMYVFNVDLTFMNIIIFPTLFGIGIDSCVHIHHRYKEEGRGSIRKVLSEVGPAITLSALTTMIGFGSLTTAANHGLRGIGWLAIIGIACTFIAAITMLPAIIQFLENRKRG